MKKLVSLMLAIIMFLGTFNISFAATTFEKDDEYVIGRLNALEIMIGKDSGFDPDGYLTRAEATTILARINGISDNQANQETNYSSFDDVPTGQWYTGHVNLARTKGIVFGVGDNKFAPNKELTYQEMLAMLTRTLGAEQLVNSLGKWPNNYIQFGIDINLVDGVGRNFSAPITRMETARLVSNALDAYVWETKMASTNGTATYEKTDRTLLEEKLNVKVYMTNDRRSGYDYRKYVVEEIYSKDREVTITNIGTRVLADFVELPSLVPGTMVDVWLDKYNRIIRIAKSENASQELIVFTSVYELDDDTIDVEIDGKEKSYRFISDTDDLVLQVNGTDIAFNKLASYIDEVEIAESTMGRFVLDDRGRISHAYFDQYDKAMVVQKVSKDVIYPKEDINGATETEIDLYKCEYRIIDEFGNEMKLDDVKKNDILLYYESTSDDYYGMLVIRDNEKSGKVSATNPNYITISSKKYYVNKLINSNSLISRLDVKDEVTLYLDLNDKIVMIDSDRVAAGDIGVVIWARAYTNRYNEPAAEIEIKLGDGTTTGIKDINFEDTEDEFNVVEGEIFKRDENVLNDKLYSGAEPLLGSLVRFVNSTKIELVEFRDGFANPNRGRGSDDEDEIVELPNGYTLSVDNKRISKSGDATYRVNSNTIVMVEKEKSADYETGVDVVEWNSLNDMVTSNKTKIFLGKIDTSTNTVDYVYIGGEISRNNTDNFAIIRSMAYSATDTYEADIITPSGDETVKIESKNIDKSKLTDYEGALLCYSESGSRIVDPTIILTKDSKGLSEAKMYTYSSSTIKISAKGETNPNRYEILDLEDEVMYISASRVRTIGAVAAEGSTTLNGRYFNMLATKDGKLYNDYTVVLDPTSADDALKAVLSNGEKTITVSWKAGGTFAPTSISQVINLIRNETRSVGLWDNITINSNFEIADILAETIIKTSNGANAQNYVFSDLKSTSSKPSRISTSQAFETESSADIIYYYMIDDKVAAIIFKK